MNAYQSLELLLFLLVLKLLRSSVDRNGGIDWDFKGSHLEKQYWSVNIFRKQLDSERLAVCLFPFLANNENCMCLPSEGVASA